jgi:hypothetical protein
LSVLLLAVHEKRQGFSMVGTVVGTKRLTVPS